MIWHLETFNFRRRRRRRGQAQNVSEWTITTKMASYSVPFRLWIIVNNLTITIRMTWNSINKLFRQSSIHSVNVVVLFYSTKKMELFINSHHKNRARRRWSPLPKPFLDSSVVCVCVQKLLVSRLKQQKLPTRLLFVMLWEKSVYNEPFDFFLPFRFSSPK